MVFSIIIPTYNGAERIAYTLKSLLSQDFPKNEYEILVVDDHSEQDLKGAVEQILAGIDCEMPAVKVIRSEKNVKAGGACNIGIAEACGTYFLRIDDDDFMTPLTLSKVYEALSETPVDVLMVDSYNCVNGQCIEQMKFSTNDTNVHSGKDFLMTQRIPWEVWHYVIKREFILANSLRFCENVFFEDTDFSLKILAFASTVRYIPWVAIHYTIRNEGQMTKIQNSTEKIKDLFLLTERMGQIGTMFPDERGKVINEHYNFQLRVILTRYLWRLKYTDIVGLMHSSTPQLPPPLIPASSDCPCIFRNFMRQEPSQCAPYSIWLSELSAA